MLFVKLHETDRRPDCLFFRFQLELRVAADNLVGLGEGPVGYDHPSSGEADSGPLGRWPEAPAPEHRSGFDLLFGELRNRVHQRLGWMALILRVLDYHHESHRWISVRFRAEHGAIWTISTKWTPHLLVDRPSPGSTAVTSFFDP